MSVPLAPPTLPSELDIAAANSVTLGEFISFSDDFLAPVMADRGVSPLKSVFVLQLLYAWLQLMAQPSNPFRTSRTTADVSIKIINYTFD